MYESSLNGGHSYSTPTSPAPYNNNSQPNERKQAYDKELASVFRASAANVTQLFKMASENWNTAHSAGYEQCYDDICEYFAAAANAEGTMAHSESNQLSMQRLVEFARLKRLAQRPTHFGPGAGRSPSISSQQHDYQQHRHNIGTQGTAPPFNIALNIALNDPQSQVELQQNILDNHEAAKPTDAQCGHAFNIPEGDSGDAMTPQRLGEVSARDQVSDDCDNILASSPMVNNGQRLLRGKRALEYFDLMDVEPPRRRQRKDDIDMA
ncbi:hypothetical protein LPJ66_007962 [Kickxella alabastrina]|uniref:Uncharacterized protein n=1 Tax=Kickxella alabastrina TaxID=61397 RepID=A0ACC1I814_9FUNG|nr:hypothetical protein LPJ66_007962 [Kickxella alabastrina]